MPDRKPVPPTGLRALRLKLGWRIGVLAAEAEVAESTVRRLETGEHKEPSGRVRRALARKLEVRASKLFGKVGK
jgi:transcriptional regulator with XRE-family HTH domain